MDNKEMNAALPEAEETMIYTLEDEDGNEHEFELIETCEKNGNTYYALAPIDDDSKDDEYCEYVILKKVIENGEECWVSIDDPDEEDDIADYFDDLFADEIDYDAKPDQGKKSAKK